MSKAMVLTYAPVSKDEAKLIKETTVLKLAINQHAEELNPQIRICSDWNLPYICHNFNQPIISVRDYFRYINPRLIPNNLEFKGATIIAAVEWLISKHYNDILIIGDNTVNTEEFQDNVNKHITPLMEYAAIWQYRFGKFQLPVKSISKFLGERDV